MQFKEEWLGDKLDNLLELLKDGTHGTHKNVDKGIYLLSAKNIKNGEIMISEEERMISIEEYKRIHKYFTLKKGDVLLTIVGSIGESAIIDDPTGYTFQRSVAYLRPKKEINSEFLYAKVNSHGFQQELINRKVLSAQAGIYLRDLSDIFIIFPSVKEQKKIGEFFKVLNEKIANQKRKIAKVKALKSAYLTEMFPQEGETVPKRRFKGFEEEWNAFELGSIGTTFSGLSGKTKKDFGHGTAEFVTYMNVFNNTISDIKVTEKVIRDDKETQLKYGDILFTTSSETPNEVGMSSVWLDDRPNVYLNSFCFGLRPSVYLDYYFMGYLLRANLFRKQMEILAQGISRYNISKSRVMEISVYLPSIKEQQKIGAFFKNLDDQITTEEKKLEKLKKMKEAYLEEMFV